MKTVVLVLALGMGAAAVGQTPDAAPQQPGYANYSIMLVNPVANGGAVVLMHDPQNALQFVPVGSTKQAFDAGFVAVRAGELDQLIGALREENARLEAENAQLRGRSAAPQVVAIAPASSGPSDAEIAERQREQMEAEKAARRQQLIQAWMGLQNMNRSQPYQLPMPRPMPLSNPMGNRLQTNCITSRVGTSAFTNCN